MAQRVRAASRRSPVVRLSSSVSDSPEAAQAVIWSGVMGWTLLYARWIASAAPDYHRPTFRLGCNDPPGRL